MIGGRGRLGRAFGIRVSVPASSSDALQTILNSLAADTWSDNVALNVQTSCKERKKSDPDFGTYYSYDGVTTIATPAAEIPFAYSSGVYVPGSKLYMFTGGGHNDWCGSEVSKFDMPTLTWSRTDESAKVAVSVEDPTVPFQSGDSSGQRAHRNPSGRFAPISSHMYGGMAYMSHNEKIYVQGAAPYQSGAGSVGGSTWIDVATGHWDEDGAYAGAPADGVDSTSQYITSCVVMTSINGTPTGATHPGIFRTWENRQGRLINPDDKTHVGGVGYFGPLGERSCHGTIIPDQDHSGFLAYVAHASAGAACVMHRCNLATSTSTNNSNTAYYNYAVAASSGVGSGTWIYMGAYVSGCEKIAVWHPSNGMHCLDISTSAWSWSSVMVGPAAVSSYNSEPVNKRFFYMPDYDAFGVWAGHGQGLYVLKRPAVFS